MILIVGLKFIRRPITKKGSLVKFKFWYRFELIIYSAFALSHTLFLRFWQNLGYLSMFSIEFYYNFICFLYYFDFQVFQIRVTG